MIDYHNLTPEQEQEMIRGEFNALIRDYTATPHKPKIELITRAFDFANKAHAGVKRRSGEPYIMHPLAVARIVVNEIGLGSTSICSALLHDVVEDTDYTVEDIEAEFGPKIASIVSGLTKISGGIFGDKASQQAENFRKLILTIPEDIRVILIKMADRLHNMRTLGSMPHAKQLKITGETQYIYAPLAQRLGFGLIKTELENLSFKYEQPGIYNKIEQQILQTTPMLEDSYQLFIRPITQLLDNYGYEYEVMKRIKSPYSVFKKMQTKKIAFEEVYDLLAVRIILKPKEGEDEKANCWVTYSAITSIYKPHPNRTRDWLSAPKSNGYEALHVTVMGPGGNWIEVQIRSERMNDIAERGLAAHWKYKTGEKNSESDLDIWFKSVKEMLDNSDFTNAVEFMDTFKLNLYSNEKFVFTPKGDIKKMPIKSTVLDFAFSLHSDLGAHCIGAKVDHRLVPLSYELQSGDQIEILTSHNQKPQMEWLDFCTTSKAKSQLRTILRKEINKLTKIGQDAVEQALISAHQKINAETLQRVLDHYHFHKTEDLYLAIGNKKININDLSEIFAPSNINKWMRIWKLQFGSGKKKEDTANPPAIDKKKTIHITDADVGSGYKIADCCQPIPGDSVLGFLDDSNNVVVHRRDCPVAQKLQASYGNRILSAEWETKKVLSFLTTIAISGIDQTGLLKQIVQIISDDYAINIKNINIDTTDGVFNGTLDIYVYSADDLENLCRNLLKIKALKSVKRIK